MHSLAVLQLTVLMLTLVNPFPAHAVENAGIIPTTFYYSFYYPDLLANGEIVNGKCADQENGICHTTNCFDYDVEAGRCRSPMASGLDWHGFIGKVVACGFEFPLGTVFRVLTPAKLAGEYICLDRCPACTGKHLLDFLSASQQLPWWTPLQVQVLP
ncbi:MAG: hypothetical protein WCE68_00455 [Anaerolineales bacterium]